MALEINILLILVLGVMPSWDQTFLNIPDPTDVGFRNIVKPSAYNFSGPVTTTGTSELMLSQPGEYQDFPEQQGHLAVLLFGPNRLTSGKKHRLNSTRQNKNSSSEPTQQYTWYMEDLLWLERKVEYPKENTEDTNSLHNRRSGTYAKSLCSLVQNLNFSVRMVADHYRIVTGPGTC
jgi:hypothetical protein